MIARAYAERDFSRAIREIMRLTDAVNQFVDQNKPWDIAKRIPSDAGAEAELHRVCSEIVHGFHALAIWLQPILPRTGERIAVELFGLGRAFRWDDLGTAPRRVAPYQHLLTRIEQGKVNAMVHASKTDLTVGTATLPAIEGGPLAPTCSVEDFQKVDIRIARIGKAENVEGADKLLKLALGAAVALMLAAIMIYVLTLHDSLLSLAATRSC